MKTAIEDIVPAEALDDTGGRGPLAAAAEAVVLPGSVEQVVEVVRWAGASGRRIVPIGTGQRGGGSMLPVPTYYCRPIDFRPSISMSLPT